MIHTVQADYLNAEHAHAIVQLLDAYARDPMGGGQPLGGYTRQHLVGELAKRNAITLLAFDADRPVGLLNAFEGFSSFACKPLINIHDLTVLPEYRGRGISQQLLGGAERIARERGCCKLTLEVLSGNKVAASAYRKFGFGGYELDPQAGRAEFWEKRL